MSGTAQNDQKLKRNSLVNLGKAYHCSKSARKVRYKAGYPARYPARHPAKHPAGHLMGCLAVGHLVKRCAGCLEGEGGM